MKRERGGGAWLGGAGAERPSSWHRSQPRAGGRQIGHQQRFPGRPRRWTVRLRGEPPIELLAAAVARRRKGLIAAFRLAVRAGEANVEMVVVAPPCADFDQPVPVGTGLAAQRALD